MCVAPVDVDLASNATVIRFKPTVPESVLKKANLEYQRCERYGVSVFAVMPLDGENQAETVSRLVGVAQMWIKPQKILVCPSAEGLLALNFRFYKDDGAYTPDEGGEPAEHYSVDLGEGTIDRVHDFLAAFTDTEEWPQ